MNPFKAIKRFFHDLITDHTPRCHDITRLVSESMEHKLPFRKRLELRLHFLACVWCVRYYRQLKFLRQAFPRYTAQVEKVSDKSLSPESKQRMKQVLQSQGKS